MCLRQALLSRRPRTKVRAINRAMFGGHVYIGEIRYAGNWGGGGGNCDGKSIYETVFDRVHKYMSVDRVPLCPISGNRVRLDPSVLIVPSN